MTLTGLFLQTARERGLTKESSQAFGFRYKPDFGELWTRAEAQSAYNLVTLAGESPFGSDPSIQRSLLELKALREYLEESREEPVIYWERVDGEDSGWISLQSYLSDHGFRQAPPRH